jgi:hypothetical protein
VEQSDAWALRAAHANDPDWSLDELVKLVDEHDAAFPLTVLTEGVFIKGLAVAVEHWADHLDGTMENLAGGAAAARAEEERGMSIDELSTAAGPSAGDIEKARAEWPQKGWRSVVNERQARIADVRQRLEEAAAGNEETSLDSLPNDLAEAAVAIDLPKVALTIKDASLFSFSGPPQPVVLPYVRVVVAHVAAWWPGGIDWR